MPGAVEDVIIKALNPDAKFQSTVLGHDHGQAWREVVVEVP